MVPYQDSLLSLSQSDAAPKIHLRYNLPYAGHYSPHTRPIPAPGRAHCRWGWHTLTALGLRELHDTDILVTDGVFESFKNQGWVAAKWSGQDGLRHDIFELGTKVRGYTVADLQNEVSIIEGVPYINLELIYCIKQQLRRQNDLRDLQIIKASANSLCSDCIGHAQTIVRRMYAAQL